MNQPSIFKAEEGFRKDFWFMPDAIYIVTVVSYGSSLLTFLVFYLAWGLIAIVFATILPSIVLFVLFFAMFGLAYLWLRMVASNRRRITLLSPIQETLENPKLSKRLQWADVRSISLTRKRKVRILIGVHAYRANISGRDYESLKLLLQGKL